MSERLKKWKREQLQRLSKEMPATYHDVRVLLAELEAVERERDEARRERDDARAELAAFRAKNERLMGCLRRIISYYPQREMMLPYIMAGNALLQDQEAAERQPAITEERGEFLMIESGDWVWCSSGYGHGCFTSQQLRWLSDELSRRSGA